MDSSIWVPVKVLPGKDALEIFVKNWKEAGSQPFNGEFNMVESKDQRRQMTTELDNISHSISEIDMASYDDQKRTVMVKCCFCGPKGAEALDKYIDKDLRLGARTVTGHDRKTGDLVQRIVTFDCIQRPNDVVDDLIHAKERLKEKQLREKFKKMK